MNPITARIQIYRKQRRYQYLLKFLYEIPEFKEWLEIFCKQCNVTKPVFHKDEKEILWAESRRHLAMSILSMLGQDDIHHIIERIEQQNREETNNE